MKNRVLIIIGLVTLLIVPSTLQLARAQTSQKNNVAKTVTLTTEEQEWLKEHSDITLGFSGSYEPYVLTESDGTLKGIMIDILAELNSRLGTKIRVSVAQQAEVIKKLNDGEIEGLLALHPDNSDERGFLKTRNYISGYPALFAAKDLVLNSPSDLAEKKIVVYKDEYYSKKIIRQYGQKSTVVYTTTVIDGLRMVDRGEADVFIGMSAGSYQISKYQLSNLVTKYVFLDTPEGFGMAVRPDLPELVPILNKALATFSKEEIDAFIAKWIQLPEQEKQLEFTQEEQTWLNEHNSVNMSLMHVPPYMFEKDGKPTGYIIDLINVLFKKLNLTSNYSFTSLKEVFEKFETGETDISSGLTFTESRNKTILFSETKMQSYWSVFAKGDGDDLGSSEALQGKTIASYEGFVMDAVVEQYVPNAKIVYADDRLGMHRLVIEGKADIIISDLHIGEFFIHENNLSTIHSRGEFKPTGFSSPMISIFNVNKNSPQLLSILDKAYESLTPAEKKAIWNKWFTAKETDELILTAKEQAWLSENKTVRVPVIDLPPYIIHDNESEPTGISIDYLNLISDRTGIRLKYYSPEKTISQLLDGLKEHQSPDLIPTIVANPERRQTILFSDEYFQSPYMIFTHGDNKQIFGGIEDLKEKKIALVQGTVLYEMMMRYYPELSLLLYAEPIEAIEAVASKEADAYIGNLMIASYLLLNRGPYNLKIAAPIPFDDQSFSIGVRNDWPELTSIIDKGLASITPNEQNEIRNKYVSVRYEQANAAIIIKWVLIVITGALGIILLFVFWNRTLRKEISKRTIELKESENKIFQTMVSSEEKERERYAKEIHDGLGPLLSTSMIYLHTTHKEENREALLGYVSRANKLLTEAMQSIQEISNNLSPLILKKYGIVTATRNFIEKLKGISTIHFVIKSNVDVRFQEIIEITIYRAITELINNSIKYAKASQIEIKIQYSNKKLLINYADNGQGFDVKQTIKNHSGNGLVNLESRIHKIGGDFFISSKVGKGMTAEITVQTSQIA